IMVGRLIDADALGLYQMAFTMSQLTTTEITTVVNQVAFPAYARLQDSSARLGRAYVRTLQLVAVASFPVAAGLWFVGPEAIQTFLGDKWVPMVPAFNILLVWGLIRSILATTGPLFRGVGRPSIATRIQAGQLLLLAALIYPMTRTFGVEGAAWATVLAAIVPGAFAIGLASRVSTASMGAILKVTAFPIVHSAVMLAALVALESTGLMPEAGWLLVWGPVVGVAVYLVATLVSRRWFGYLAGGLLPPESSRKDA
ncbi:MAG: oligosaccharide flippase family protein, partial [Acidimicrobiia bacterium]